MLIAVFGVSILYEILLAERHFQTFFGSLRGYIELGETDILPSCRICRNPAYGLQTHETALSLRESHFGMSQAGPLDIAHLTW